MLLRAPGGANGGSDAMGASCSTGGNCSVMGQIIQAVRTVRKGRQ
jgi:hypothetical protein